MVLFFDQKGLESIGIPVEIVAGESDEKAPINANAKFFAQNIKGAKLDILPGKVNHFVFLNLPTELGKKILPPYITQDDPSVDRAKLHDEVGRMAIKFFDSNLNP